MERCQLEPGRSIAVTPTHAARSLAASVGTLYLLSLLTGALVPRSALERSPLGASTGVVFAVLVLVVTFLVTIAYGRARGRDGD